MAKDFISEYVAQRDTAVLEHTAAEPRDGPKTSTTTSASHVPSIPITIPDVESKADSKAKGDIDRAELKQLFLESFSMSILF